MDTKVEVLPCINPATGEKFGEVRAATPEDVTHAHKEMHQNFAVWRRKPIQERVRILRKLQALIIDSLDEITAVINQDTGKSRQDALIEVMVVVDRLHQYYKNAYQWLRRRRVPPGLYFFRQYYAEPAPYGVIAVISPWNIPFDLSMSPVCAALLAGNTVILKPSEVTPATGALMESLFQRVPELSPYVRVVHGDGRVGAKLVESNPDLVYLTGSTATGKKIAQTLSQNMTPFLCELGGKDPMIVLEDADVKAAAKWGVWGAFYHAGQICQSVERVYVVESVYDEFVREVEAETEKFIMGYSPEIQNICNTGPLTFERQCNVVDDHMKDALGKGARVIVSGEKNGRFIEPVVVVDVDHSMKLMKEETFGPVMPIMKVKDETEAIWLANDTVYGLSACVWSNNIERAKHVAEQLNVGSVNINDVMSHYAVSLLPFGGMKQSGNARTHGKQDVLQFTQLRSYAVGRPPLAIDLATQMRKPNNYRLGAAIMRLMFGVTPQQRIQPVVEALEALNIEEVKPKVSKLTAALGITAALAAFLVGLVRWRK